MNNYIEHNNTIAFCPGYYINELIDESGVTQENFAKRLDITPKNLSSLIRGEQSLSQSELRLPLLQVVSSNKYFSVGVQSPTEINAPRGRTLSGRQWFCADRNGVQSAVILKRRCQLALTRITHQVSRAFDLNCQKSIVSSAVLTYLVWLSW